MIDGHDSVGDKCDETECMISRKSPSTVSSQKWPKDKFASGGR